MTTALLEPGTWTIDAAHTLVEFSVRHMTVARVTGRFAAVSGDQWRRPGRRSDGAVFTVESFGRYLVHDPVHHLYDVTGVRYSAG